MKFNYSIPLNQFFKINLTSCFGLLLFTFFCFYTFAQYPSYFTYNDEKGLPTNEVYSLAQDNDGFIWMGGDAGLFRFNGVNYQSYKSKFQKSRSLTGLTISSSGRLYCYNFIGQLFVHQGDSLHFLKREFQTLNNVSADLKGNIYVSHLGGISIYNEHKKQWRDLVKNIDFNSLHLNKYTSKCTSRNKEGKVAFINSKGVNTVTNSKIKTKTSLLFKDVSPGLFLLEYFENELYIFSIYNQKIYQYSNNRIKEFKSSKLLNTLKGRKLTKIKNLKDGKLWICTYTGLIQFDPKKDKVNLFYPELSFSDCLIDSEGNYWFSTLQSGLLRIANLNQMVWNKENGLTENDRVTKLTYDGKHIFFANAIGTVGQLNLKSNELKFFQSGNKADVQSLDFDPLEKRVLFSINNLIYFIQNSELRKSNIYAPATKSIARAEKQLLLGSSSKLVSFYQESYKELMFNWIRVVKYDSHFKNLWVACNDGLLLYQQDELSNWSLKKSFLKDKQILSIEPDIATKNLIAFGFDGMIYRVHPSGIVQTIAQLPINLQGKKIALNKDKIFIATNKGVFIFNQKKRNWKSLNKFSGLASNNIQDILIIENYLWLATGKGLQKFSIDAHKLKPLPKISISKLKIEGKLIENYTQNLKIESGQKVEVFPEVVSYTSQGNFKFAFRISGGEWIKLPANIGKISIPNIPSGEFEIEVVAFDYLGRKSANSIKIKGWVYPPFWESNWFYFIVALLFVLLVVGISRYIIQNIRKKALLETELSNLKLTAIKAQMNPHFIFNALNSIQDLILKGDVENSYSYIITFSNLVRKTLEYSGKSLVDFDQEIELLKLYLSLENLRFKNELQTELIVPEIENVSIPPMLIQPFIENALIHGLLHKEGVKKLKIEFQLNHQLICIIEDNGVGRKQSKIIKNRRGVNHASFSSNAIQKRFEILNKSSEFKYGFKYEDLIENKQVMGTKVTIIIPFKPMF